MRFRLRIYSIDGVWDFILPQEERFVVGSKPQSEGHFLITEPYVLDEHLVFEIKEEEEENPEKDPKQIKKKCQVHIPESTDTHDTHYNDQPLAMGQTITLHDGDRLVIRPQLVDESKLTIDDPMIALVFEVLEDDVVGEQLDVISAAMPVQNQAEMGGLQPYSMRLLHYLPEIYQVGPTPEIFLSRFLAGIERVLLPAEWTISNFDLLLDLKTVPEFFLPWLEKWVALDEEWDNLQSRALLAHYPWRGTRHGLRCLLAAYTGYTPEIAEGLELPLFTFHVHLPVREEDLLKQKLIKRAAIERLIQATKPIHITYQLTFAE